MLELAAVFTGGFGFDQLQALTGVGEVELLECLEDALGAELLRSLGGERYDFSHTLVRHALYEGLSPSRRARLHRRLADALERLYEEPPARVAAEVARQYHASVTLPGAERGVSYALKAAEHARMVHAPAEAVELLRLALESAPDRDDALEAQVLGSLAVSEAQAGMPSQAVTTLESAIALVGRGGAGGREIAELTCEVATAMWGVTASPAPGAALIEPALDRYDDAAAAFARARERLEREGQLPIRAIVDFDEALARSWRGQPGSAELLLAAETQFERLGMTVWSERIAGLRHSREGLPDGLTRREAEVLRLLASGLTNRQIAEQLVLSVHTVVRHVNNAYAKIGARNRADASAYTVRHGL